LVAGLAIVIWGDNGEFSTVVTTNEMDKAVAYRDLVFWTEIRTQGT
jgi:hypothetical protein